MGTYLNHTLSNSYNIIYVLLYFTKLKKNYLLYTAKNKNGKRTIGNSLKGYSGTAESKNICHVSPNPSL